MAKMVESLFNSGVPLDESDNDDYTPLQRAVEKGNKLLVSYLISIGADVNKKSNQRGGFPLLTAVTKCNEDMVKLLLSNGARINEKDKFGWTALHVACLQRSESVTNLLMHKGADITAVVNNGRTAFSLLEPSHCQRYHHHCWNNIVVMIKEFSKLRVEKLLTSKIKSDIDLIQKNSRTRKCFEKCTMELDLMTATKFYGPYSYYSVLKMSKNIERLAPLTKNNEFVFNFNKNLPKFQYYQNDLKRILAEAFCVRQKLDIIEQRLNLSLGSILPSVVIRNLRKYLTVQDLPLD